METQCVVFVLQSSAIHCVLVCVVLAVVGLVECRLPLAACRVRPEALILSGVRRSHFWRQNCARSVRFSLFGIIDNSARYLGLGEQPAVESACVTLVATEYPTWARLGTRAIATDNS